MEGTQLPARTVFRSLGWSLVLAAAIGCFALISIASAATGGVGSHIGWGLVAGIAVILCARGLRVALVVDDEEIVVRGYTRTHRLPWSKVSQVSAGDSGNVTGQGKCIVLSLTDGGRIHARGVMGYSRKIEETAQAINALRPEP